MVKWCSLPYEDATWELREDVDEGKVEEFRKIQDRQPQLKRTVRVGIHWLCVFTTFHVSSATALIQYVIIPQSKPFTPLISPDPKQLHGRSWRNSESTRVGTYSENTS